MCQESNYKVWVYSLNFFIPFVVVNYCDGENSFSSISCKISPIKFKSWTYIFSPVFDNSVANGNVWLLLWSLGNVSGNSGNSGDSCQSSATGTGLASYLRKANFEDEYSQLYKNDLPFFSNNFLKAIISETHICWKWNYWHFILWEAYKFHLHEMML